jgi:deoxyribonuclease I
MRSGILIASIILTFICGGCAKQPQREPISAEPAVSARPLERADVSPEAKEQLEELRLRSFPTPTARREAEIAVLEAMSDEDVAELAREEMSTNTQLSWDQAKRYVYNELNANADSVVCVYGGGHAILIGAVGKRRPEPAAKFSVEHIWLRRAIWGGIGVDNMPESDLHHLYATHQSLNSSRGEHYYGVPITQVRILRLSDAGTIAHEGEGGVETGCRRGRDADDDIVFEPPPEHRGNAARAIFYISVRYEKPIPEKLEATLRQWHEDDPVDEEETLRCDEIERIQGNRNLFVDRPELVELVEDF